jgi:hypothetical protein
VRRLQSHCVQGRRRDDWCPLSRGNPAPVGTRTMLKEQSFHSGGFIRMADDILGCAFVLLTASMKRSSHEWPVPGGGTSGGSTGAGDGSQIQRPLSRPISPASASTTVPARKKLVSFQTLCSPGIFLQFLVSRQRGHENCLVSPNSTSATSISSTAW